MRSRRWPRCLNRIFRLSRVRHALARTGRSNGAVMTARSVKTLKFLPSIIKLPTNLHVSNIPDAMDAVDAI